jgi:ribosomal protein L21E
MVNRGDVVKVKSNPKCPPKVGLNRFAGQTAKVWNIHNSKNHPYILLAEIELNGRVVTVNASDLETV